MGKNDMKRKLILITGILLSTSLWAEQKFCDISWADDVSSVLPKLDKCPKGDLISWTAYLNRPIDTTVGRAIIHGYCDQNLQITTLADFTQGVCTSTGKKLERRRL